MKSVNIAPDEQIQLIKILYYNAQKTADMYLFPGTSAHCRPQYPLSSRSIKGQRGL